MKTLPKKLKKGLKENNLYCKIIVTTLFFKIMFYYSNNKIPICFFIGKDVNNLDLASAPPTSYKIIRTLTPKYDIYYYKGKYTKLIDKLFNINLFNE